MMRINLLPWREARRLQRQRDLIGILVGVALVTCGIVFMGYTEIDNRIEFQRERNEYLRGEIARLKKAAEELAELQKARSRLVDRINVIQKLQTSRPGMVRMLDELVRLLPEDIFLTSFKTLGDRVTLNGTARSDLIISEFMRDIKASQLLGEPVLQIIQTRDVNNIQARVFELSIPLKLSADQAGGKT
ncbi:MAG TPA: PilN domain-containing protein [Candidatus Competibacteraceae bacterium]|nr:PilN domain-containing protein [Gammaproteobacteria bacterium]HPF58040.1 PilN domain-containing protein [Candidatus Competibacteraceae bacterium]HRY19021.1 PilN domain-containing protein [Candidatus Competibacteraceae bacterium]